MTQTIAQQIKWDFTNGDLQIQDKNGRTIYLEHSDGDWSKSEYDSKGNVIYYENSDKVWEKWEYDSEGNLIYFEDSDGEIEDNRPKPLEIEVTTTKTYKVGDSVECLTDDGWMDGGITDIDLSKRVLFVYIEEYDEIRKFNTNQIK
jgi:hypothetical protein